MAEARSPEAGRAWFAFQRSEIERGGLRTCFLDRLASIDQPTLLLSGGQDRLVRYSDCQRAASLMRDARLEILEPCGHWIGRDQPDQLVTHVNDFLATTDPTRS
jgi:pimeloyl-ACP methyl ester carboxylesterase